jgi:hypothetical protein
MSEKSVTTDHIPAARRGVRLTLAAVGVTVMALTAFLGTTKPALAAPVSGAGAASAHLSLGVAGDGICVISGESPACSSSDTELVVDSVNTGDTEACTFTWKMYWGDGKTQIVTRDGGTADERFIFKALHHYRETRETKIYIVRWDAVSVTGGCQIGSDWNEFILEPR